MAEYLRLEMPYYLLQSYSDLAIAQIRYLARYPGARYPGFQHNFALISINAAIIEGTLRSAMHWYLFEKAEAVTKKGISLGQSEPDLAERTLIKLRVEVDTSDTWNKLKSNFQYIFGLELPRFRGQLMT